VRLKTAQLPAWPIAPDIISVATPAYAREAKLTAGHDETIPTTKKKNVVYKDKKCFIIIFYVI
jgi:hypothetical protein